MVDFDGDFHPIELAGINPRPSMPIPIWFGGLRARRSSSAAPGSATAGCRSAHPNESSRERLEEIRDHRAAAGPSMDGFAVQAQAQYAGGDPQRWRTHAERWRELGATHLAVATHNAGPTDADGHLRRVAEYLDAVRDV